MLKLDTLKELLRTGGFQEYRAKQIIHSIFKEGKSEYSQISNIPKDLINFMEDKCPILQLTKDKCLTSKKSGTIKCRFKTQDNKNIESVLMKFKDKRNSICVSSQVGCQLGCKFCATGTMKFGRNLTDEEICDQVLYFHQNLLNKNQKITNIVYMGMGEPLMNYENVMKSIRTLNDKNYFNIGARNITVSTAGIAPGIKKMADENIQINLAVSLHGASQELREKIMPLAKLYSLEDLMESISYYLKKTNRRVTYEYLMLKDINDSDEDAAALANLIKYQLCHVNLIPYNETGIPNMHGSKQRIIAKFRKIIEDSGIPVTVRVSLGQDIDAACGQLANK